MKTCGKFLVQYGLGYFIHLKRILFISCMLTRYFYVDTTNKLVFHTHKGAILRLLYYSIM